MREATERVQNEESDTENSEREREVGGMESDRVSGS